MDKFHFLQILPCLLLNNNFLTSFAAETGEYFCGQTSTSLKVSWQSGDATKARVFVRYHSLQQACTMTPTASGRTLTVNYGECGIDALIQGSNNQTINVTMVSTVLNNGAISSSSDKLYQYQCHFYQGKPYADVSKSAVINPQSVITPGDVGLIPVSLQMTDLQFVPITDVSVGTKILAEITFEDSLNVYQGGGIIVDVTYAASDKHPNTPTVEVIADGCSTGDDGSPAETPQVVGQKTGNKVTLRSSKIKAVLLDVEGDTKLTVHVTATLCAVANDPRCQPVNCQAKKAGRRRREAEEGLYIAFARATLTVRKAHARPEKPASRNTSDIFTIVPTTLAGIFLFAAATFVVYVIVQKTKRRSDRVLRHVLSVDAPGCRHAC